MASSSPTSRTAYITSSKFAGFKLPEGFPYEFDRGARILDFCRSQGLMDRPWMSLIEAREAAEDDLLLFHTPKYIEALKTIGNGKFRPEYLELGFGSPDCPIFFGMYEYALIAAGATLTAARAVSDDGFAIAFNPSGGLHHAGREKAEGFCYVNDVVIGIMWLKEHKPGIRVCYADIDAHHPNGVQDAFYLDDKVLCISMHQTGESLYPYSGFESETGAGPGTGYTINVPLEPKSDDDVFREGFDEIVMPAIRKYGPDLLVTQLGVDMLHSDPLTDLNMTGHSHAYAMEKYLSLGCPLLALGGGGYRRETYIQTNALIWSTMNKLEDEDSLRTLVGGVFLGDPGIHAAGLKEPRRYTIGEEKTRTRESLRKTISYLKRSIPLLK
jgi:acetoin utilization protein AcuC